MMRVSSTYILSLDHQDFALRAIEAPSEYDADEVIGPISQGQVQWDKVTKKWYFINQMGSLFSIDRSNL
jgi:hypothetical protein